ncbi:MAG: alpha/beta fold hydrolase [Methanosarcina sp.]|uniref:alpha/beta hydrolase family protein n=1 Tax=Methanosarcina sp. TaxID=2213 RepID=UPI002626E24D|nr:alpha/beta fold hydrolase [Methanosarcina sp.]MDD3248415.1 alpha/beta fold hydrolase [Methanosarcina sp.]
MDRKIVILAVLLLVTVAGPGCISQPENTQSENSQQNNMSGENIQDIKDIEGMWLGTLEVPGGNKLRLLFNISTSPEGSITATMDSLDQGANGIPVETVTYKDGNLHLEVKSIRGVFEGTLQEDGKTIDGEWKQAGSVFPLALSLIGEKPEIRREQDPVKPYPYDEEEVVYENKEAGVTLAGTLTLPRSEGPFPAVILITGSGPQNRDEGVFGHRPFLVLSDYLTRQGIAVLRVDDRGIGGSTGNSSQATTEDFSGDVLAGIEYLKSREEIDSTRIGLIGHSEGGLIAPIVAVQSPDVAFIVMMAGPGLTGEEIILLQSDLIARAEGADNETIARNNALMKSMYSVIKEEQNNTIAAEKLRNLLEDEMANMSEEEKQNSNYSEADLDAQVNGQVQALLSPWMRFFLTYDPKPTLMQVKCPVLAINGEKDLQVPPEENLQAIEEALKAGGNKDYTVKELPGLNHLFQTAKTGSPSEYAAIEETISPTALEVIGDWISEHTQEK